MPTREWRLPVASRQRARFAGLAAGLVAIGLCCACSMPSPSRDTALDGLRVDRLDPGLVVLGSTLVISGSGFVTADLGSSRLVLDGKVDEIAVNANVALTFQSPTRVQLVVGTELVSALGGRLSGTFSGTAAVEVLSTVDGQSHRSVAIETLLQLAAQSTPAIDTVVDGTTWVNQPIEVDGSGFLLGGGEGELLARVLGCFTPEGASACGAPISQNIPAAPFDEFDRAHARFPYASTLSGIGPGRFVGTVTLVNHPIDGPDLSSSAVPVTFDIQRPRIVAASPTSASLGQYVLIDGNGFVGAPGSNNESTVLRLVGSFVDDKGKTTAVDAVLVPEVLSGPRLRYVLDETDTLGKVLALRTQTGTLTGTVQPTVQQGAVKLAGTLISVQLQLAPVRQVLYVSFLDSYLASLRHFGLRAADSLIRKRVLALSAQLFAGVNLDVRDREPTDFALYSVVDVAGPDPNGMGYFGYDNTPGKDVDNVRLYDHVGGINAVTQADGASGYGGVFTENFFAFSVHPNGLAAPVASTEAFDRIFDAFRADAGGTELTGKELSALSPVALNDGSSCPAPSGDRAGQLRCAVWTLGNLIASTMVHEVGHSLGLADPHGATTTYHNQGDLPNRLMEVGAARPFDERAMLGAGPAQFCVDEFAYLRQILPSSDAAPAVQRQPCD